MNPDTQQTQQRGAALTLVRQFVPDTTHVQFTTTDQDPYGFARTRSERCRFPKEAK